MFSRKEHRMPTWLPSTPIGKGKGYSEITGTSANDPFELDDLDA